MFSISFTYLIITICNDNYHYRHHYLFHFIYNFNYYCHCYCIPFFVTHSFIHTFIACYYYGGGGSCCCCCYFIIIIATIKLHSQSHLPLQTSTTNERLIGHWLGSVHLISTVVVMYVCAFVFSFVQSNSIKLSLYIVIANAIIVNNNDDDDCWCHLVDD